MEEIASNPEGTIVPAALLSLGEPSAVVSLEGHGEGVLPASELSPKGQEPPAVGARFAVYVDHRSDGGRFVVSKEKADRLGALQRIEDAFRSGATIDGEIVGEMPGGFAVDVGVKAFLPASQVGMRPPRDADEVLGQTLAFKVIRYDRARTNIVLSRRALLEVERDKTFDRLKIGSIVEGVVVRLIDFGAFVDLGTIEGLLHVSDISWGKIAHPSEVVKVGQSLTLKVLRFDKKNQKLSLGLRQLEDDPWVHAKAKYPPKAKVKGPVISKTDYGCFIEIEPGLEGLVHATGPMVTDAAKDRIRRIDIGDELDAIVLDLDLTAKRLSLAVDESHPAA